MPIDRGTLIRRRTTLRGPLIIGDHCDIGPNTYIGPYTSIGDHTTIRNTETENSIVMEGAYVDCWRRITDSLMGRKVTSSATNKTSPRAAGSSSETWQQSPSNPDETI